MAAFYEVWDFETRNIINTFDTEVAALLFVRGLLELNGTEGIRELGIVRQGPDASGEYEPTLVADGLALLARVRASDEANRKEVRRAAD